MVEVRSFAAACLVVAAGFEPRKVVVTEDGVAAFYFEDAARVAVERFQSVKALLRGLEGRARREVSR